MRENKGINRIDTRNIPHFEQKYHDFTGKCKSYSPLVFQQRFDQIHSQSIPSAIVCCIKQESSLFTFRNQTPGITRSGYPLIDTPRLFNIQFLQDGVYKIFPLSGQKEGRIRSAAFDVKQAHPFGEHLVAFESKTELTAAFDKREERNAS